MPDFYFDVDAAITEAPVNLMPLIDDTDFKSRETGIAYNASGMDLVWNFVTSAGVFTQTAVTPTTGGDYDWTHQGDGIYTIEIPASGGASINNDTEGYGWFSGFVTGVLPWRGPTIGFRAAAINDALCDGGDLLDVSVTEIGGDSQSATDLKDFADAGYDPATNKVQGVVLTDTVTTLTGHTAQTGDSYARLGAPAGASVSADVAAVKSDSGAIKTVTDALPDSGALSSLATSSALATVDSNVDAILVDTGTDIPARFDGIEGATFSTSTDSLEALRNRGDSAWTTGAGGTPPQLLQNTTIATLASQTSFTLTAGSADDDAYNGAVVVVTDQSTSTQKAVGSVSDYTGSTKTVTLSADPGIFTMAVGDSIDVIANASTAPSAAAVRAEIDSNSTQLAAIVADTNELQTDWANGGRLDLILDARSSQASVDTAQSDLDTLTGSDGVTLATSQPNYAPNTTTPPTAAAIADQVWDEAQAGHVSAGSFGEIATEIASILTDTAEIGSAGAGLSNIPWNASWDAEVQSECADAITAASLATAASISALNDVAATDIVSNGAITTLSGAVVNVDTVDTCTTNTDMRGTDSAATAAALATVDSNVDAVKAKTDNLTFTVSNQVDANIQSINDTTITGDGQSGTEFGV